MEDDYNQLSTLFFGRHMIKEFEIFNQIPAELYANRACLNAILVAVNRRLVIDIFKQKRGCGAITGVDAA